MGGMTNIHYEDQLFRRAGHSMVTQAVIMPMQKSVVISNQDADKHHIAELNNLQISGSRLHSGKWFSGPRDFEAEIMAPEPWLHPQVMVTPALDIKKRHDEKKLDLCYLAVIQGKQGASRSKCIVRSNPRSLAASILHEAINGYSTVFTGCFLGSAVVAKEFEWVIARSLPDLDKIQEENEKRLTGCPNVVGIWCVDIDRA